MDILKASKYNFLTEVDGQHVAFNSKNCALAKVNDIFLNILKNPNSEIFARVELRKQMLASGFLVDASVDETKLLELDYYSSIYNKEQLMITILPTLDCNFDCFYCFENKKKEYLSEEIEGAIKQFVSKKIKGVKKFTVCWFGGEPLMGASHIWRLSEFFVQISERNNCEYNAMMITNGSLVNDTIIEQIKKSKIEILQITIDGTEEYHNSRRYFKGGAPSFSIIMKNIKKLTSSGIRVSVRMNIDKNNIHSVKELLHVIGKQRWDNFQVSFGQILPLGVADKWNTDSCFTTEEFSLAITELSEVMKTIGIKIGDDYPFYPKPILNFCSACHINSFVIHPNGDVHKCYDCNDYKIGNIKGELCSSAIEKNNCAHWITESPFKDQECLECKVLPICMGACPYLKEKFGKKYCLKWKHDLFDTICKKIR